jgi:hypothetical protein
LSHEGIIYSAGTNNILVFSSGRRPTKTVRAAQISTAMRVLAKIIANDALFVTSNHVIDGVLQNNPKARANPKALAQLGAYKRPLVSSLSRNLQRFGVERVAKVESLQQIIARNCSDIR